MRPRLLHVLLLLGCTAAGAASLARPAGATVGAVRLSTVPTRVQGGKLAVSVELTRGRYHGGESPRLTVSVQSFDDFPAGEAHDLDFTLEPGSVHADAGRRVIHISSGGQMGRWGSIDMTFRASDSEPPEQEPLGTCSIATTTLIGRLQGSLTVRLDGVGTLRVASLPASVERMPSIPLGCAAPPPDTCHDSLAPIIDPQARFSELLTPADPTASWDESQFVLDAVSGRLPSESEETGLAGVIFTDPAAATAPALVSHFALTFDFELLTDTAARSASLRFSGSLLAGSLAFSPDPSAPTKACGSNVVLAGTISGDVSASFRWSSIRRFSGIVPGALWLPADGPPVAPA